MEVAALVLEYLKVLLSSQMVAGMVAVAVLFLFRADIAALMKRVASIRLPGGTELSTPQLERVAEDRAGGKKPPDVPPGAGPDLLPKGIQLTPDQAERVREVLDAERANATLWEFRYLNDFLVPNTQRVLDWLASLSVRTSYPMYDSLWLPLIPNADERRAIIDALKAHGLVSVDAAGLIDVADKGRAYIGWRGPLPDEPS